MRCVAGYIRSYDVLVFSLSAELTIDSVISVSPTHKAGPFMDYYYTSIFFGMTRLTFVHSYWKRVAYILLDSGIHSGFSHILRNPSLNLVPPTLKNVETLSEC